MTEQELKVKVEYALSHEFNHTLHAYIDITNDLVSATLLSQILYWFTPSKNGKSKVKIIKDGFYWIAKKRSDWYREIRITEKQCDRAIKLLTDFGFIETKKYKFDGSPTTHIRPLYDNINQALNKWKENKAKEILCNENEEGGNWNLTFGEIPNIPNGELEIPETEKTLTEFTTENTAKPNNIIDENFEKLWKMLKSTPYDRKSKVTKKRKKELYDMGFERVEKAVKLYLKVQNPKYYYKRDNFFNEIIDNFLDKEEQDFNTESKVQPEQQKYVIDEDYF